MTESDIRCLLRRRHARDVVVEECSIGPHAPRRIDFWAMAKSYTRPAIKAYEIKMSRSDFLADNKWNDYLPYCNQLWFVCPYKLIMPEEVPVGCGLLWTASTGTRLYTKRKAEHREIELPQDFWTALVINRCQINRREWYGERNEDEAAYWAGWLEKRKENRELGHRVSRKIREIVAEQTKLRHIAEMEAKRVKPLNDWLKSVGLDCWGSVSAEQWERRAVAELEAKVQVRPALPAMQISELERAAKMLDHQIRALRAWAEETQ